MGKTRIALILFTICLILIIIVICIYLIFLEFIHSESLYLNRVSYQTRSKADKIGDIACCIGSKSDIYHIGQKLSKLNNLTYFNTNNGISEYRYKNDVSIFIKNNILVGAMSWKGCVANSKYKSFDDFSIDIPDLMSRYVIKKRKIDIYGKNSDAGKALMCEYSVILSKDNIIIYLGGHQKIQQIGIFDGDAYNLIPYTNEIVSWGSHDLSSNKP